MDEKFWKKFQMFLLVRSIYWVIFPPICSTRGDWVPCLDTFSDVRNRVFLTFSHVSGEWYERKILKKIPVVLLSRAYHLSYYTLKSVAWNSHNRVPTSIVLKSRFFHFEPRCWRIIRTKNSVKNFWRSSW